ncbi:MAG: exodeoxyribonuclease VII large subunit [Chthoniobacteraceae bacterium]
MTDSFDLGDARREKPRNQAQVLTVTEVNRTVRGVLEEGIGQIWVEGEVSNYRKQASGHQYFTLKDEQCQLSCVMFARPGMWRRDVPLSEGMCIQAKGTLTVYEARGQYQLNVQLVQASGAGMLQARFDALKRKLAAEGLFSLERKRPLPSFPTTIAIVTSPTGAAIRDMLNVLSRRAPWLRVVISPVRVQGEGAAEEIAAAIHELNAHSGASLPKLDVIIVGRGGGSVEDLWEFNEEIVARAIAASDLPVISAVGHEIDFTISDFAADVRAPTPSAAAELVAPDSAELLRRLQERAARLHRCASVHVERQKQYVTSLARSRLFREPRERLGQASQRLDLAAENLEALIRDRVTQRSLRVEALLARLRHHRPDQLLAMRRQQVAALGGKLRQVLLEDIARCKEKTRRLADVLRLLSPEATLQRGYSITTSAEGELLTSAEDARRAKRLRTRFADGAVNSEVV